MDRKDAKSDFVGYIGKVEPVDTPQPRLPASLEHPVVVFRLDDDVGDFARHLCIDVLTSSFMGPDNETAYGYIMYESADRLAEIAAAARSFDLEFMTYESAEKGWAYQTMSVPTGTWVALTDDIKGCLPPKRAGDKITLNKAQGHILYKWL